MISDYPLAEVAKTIEKLIENGHVIYQKFTCAVCGARLTMEEPNTLFTSGTCECGYTTPIKKCNYLLVMKGGKS